MYHYQDQDYIQEDSQYFEEDSSQKQMEIVLTQHQEKFIQAMYAVSVRHTSEMLALGKCTIDEKKITLSSLFIPRHETSPAFCRIKDSEIAKMIMKGKTFNFWIHTHPDMGAFWSGTDTATIDALSGTSPFFVSIVIGKNGMIGRIDVRSPKIYSNVGITCSGKNDQYTRVENIFKSRVSQIHQEDVPFETPVQDIFPKFPFEKEKEELSHFPRIPFGKPKLSESNLFLEGELT